MRSPRSPAPRIALLLVLALAALPLAGCGGGGYVDVWVPVGTVWVENDTSTLPVTVMLDFALWPVYAAPSSANLLPFELYPGDVEPVADVYEDYYDADAYMSDGFFDYLEVWFDVYVPAGDDTTFFAF